MSDIKLGEIITDEVYRDAAHVAVAPVTSSYVLRRGEWVKFVTSDTVVPVSCKAAADGIVDPMLDHNVFFGAKCYIWLKPGIAMNVRHHWDHPKFVDQGPIPVPRKGFSEKGLIKAHDILETYIDEDAFCCNYGDDDCNDTADVLDRVVRALQE